jgi:hypothetical protein
MTYQRVCNKSNTTDATSGAGTVNFQREPEFTTACVMNSGTFTVENSYNPDDDGNEMTTNVSA